MANESWQKICREISKKVVFIHSKDYLDVCKTVPKLRDRANIIYGLIKAYNLLEKMRIEAPSFATKKSLMMFHSRDYIDVLEKLQDCWKKNNLLNDNDGSIDDVLLMNADAEKYGIGYDCQPFERLFDFVCLVAGATVKCAEILNEGNVQISINLDGGWHHAHRDEAAGFCYVNDIVLGILKLREKFQRVLYIDLDIHHGDGVEEAFISTDKVMTVSFHKHQNGFFPGTGNLADIGIMHGKYHTVNVPLKEGINDEQYYHIFTRIMDAVKKNFEPEVVVCQCGADGISGDPLGGFNLTATCIPKCVQYINQWRLPLLILGGGGYNFASTSKCWVNLLAALLDEELDQNIPEHEYFYKYSPCFDISVIPSTIKSANTQEYLDEIVSHVTENLERIQSMRIQKLLNSKSDIQKKTITKRRIHHHRMYAGKDLDNTQDIGSATRKIEQMKTPLENLKQMNIKNVADENDKNIENMQSFGKRYNFTHCSPSKRQMKTLDRNISKVPEVADVGTTVKQYFGKSYAYQIFDFDGF